ncbi:MAG: type II secretion system F family protein, partial [Desulfobacterales bacterium]
RSSKQKLIKKIKSGSETVDLRYEAPSSEDSQPSFKTAFLNLFKAVGSFANPKRSADNSEMRIKFLRAGIRTENAMPVFWGVKLLLVVVLSLIFIGCRISIFKLMSYQAAVAIGVLSALIGFYLPDIWLKYRSHTRKQKILESLPDALDLLVICVEAGMGMDGAINRITKEIRLNSPILADELNFLNLELRAGKLRQDALRNLAMRTDLDEMSSLVTLLVQTDKFGTSVADALRVYSDSFRTQRYQRAEELAAKIPVKLVLPLILFILPALFVVIVGPAAIRIYQNLLSRF